MDDDTLGGYERVHARPPAFGGADGNAYTVSIFVEDEPDERAQYGAALLFLRWSPGGERPIGHVETDYLAFGTTPEDARARLADLPLHEVKRHLDLLTA
jgi:hypothetical protein